MPLDQTAMKSRFYVKAVQACRSFGPLLTLKCWQHLRMDTALI